MEPKECECDKRKSHTSKKLHMIYVSSNNIRHPVDGFGGLVVSMLASGTQVCGFKPGRWIFRT